MTAATSSEAIDATAAARRVAAVGALALLGIAVAIAAVGLVGDLGRLLVTPLLLLLVTAMAWVAVTRTGTVRVVATIATVALLGLVIVVLLTAEGHGLGLVVVLALLTGSTGLVRYALRRDPKALRAQPPPGSKVGPAGRGVLVMNLRSGGGKAERFALAEECRRRGIEPVILGAGDDLLELAQGAIDRGADVIGMAGGDGSQALVASVAMAADVPLVCVPAGTRNRFALDLGMDRNDVLAALDAFGAAVERRIDLGTVNGRVFVNNVSLGVYAKIVRSPAYRDAKRQTTTAMLSDLAGPRAEPFDLHLVGPRRHPTGRRADHPGVEQPLPADVLRRVRQPGPPRHRRARRRGGRPPRRPGHRRLPRRAVDGPPRPVPRLDGAGRPTRLTIESSRPIEAGVDGEALLFDPPLELRSLPGALRVRIPATAPGYSPAALRAPSPWWTLTALLRAAAGQTTPIDEAQR